MRLFSKSLTATELELWKRVTLDADVATLARSAALSLFAKKYTLGAGDSITPDGKITKAKKAPKAEA